MAELFGISWVAKQRGMALATRRSVPPRDCWIAPTSTAIAVTGSARDDHAVGGVNVAEDIAGNFLDKIGVGPVGRQQCNVLAKPGAHGLQASNLKFDEIRLLEQCRARLETVPSVYCVMGEIGRRAQARKQHKNLSDPQSPIIHLLYAIPGCSWLRRNLKPGTPFL